MAEVYYISGIGKRSYPRIGETITATSTPILDGWGWDEYWNCEQWKQWHIELVKTVGLTAANNTFKLAWDAQDSFANPYNWCKYESAWVNYFLSQGLDLRSVISAIIVPIATLPGTVVQTGSTVITNTAGAASAISSLIKPAAFAALAFGAYYVYKKAK